MTALDVLTAALKGGAIVLATLVVLGVIGALAVFGRNARPQPHDRSSQLGNVAGGGAIHHHGLSENMDQDHG